MLMMIGLIASELPAAETVSVADQVQMIITTSGRYHYAPRPIDDEFSKRVFDTFLKTLDPAGIIFTGEQITRLTRFRTLVDNQIKNQSTAFADTVALILEKQLTAVETQLHGMEQREFDFSRNDTLWLGGEVTYGNTELREKRWEQFFRYLILYLCHTNRDSTGKSKIPSRELSKKLATEVVARETCKLQLKRKTPGGVRQSVGQAYLKAIAAAFDPHTVYLSTAEREMFENELSASAGSFGMSISLTPLGEVEVSTVSPERVISDRG